MNGTGQRSTFELDNSDDSFGKGVAEASESPWNRAENGLFRRSSKRPPPPLQPPPAELPPPPNPQFARHGKSEVERNSATSASEFQTTLRSKLTPPPLPQLTKVRSGKDQMLPLIDPPRTSIPLHSLSQKSRPPSRIRDIIAPLVTPIQYAKDTRESKH